MKKLVILAIIGMITLSCQNSNDDVTKNQNTMNPSKSIIKYGYEIIVLKEKTSKTVYNIDAYVDQGEIFINGVEMEKVTGDLADELSQIGKDALSGTSKVIGGTICSGGTTGKGFAVIAKHINGELQLYTVVFNNGYAVVSRGYDIGNCEMMAIRLLIGAF